MLFYIGQIDFTYVNSLHLNLNSKHIKLNLLPSGLRFDVFPYCCYIIRLENASTVWDDWTGDENPHKYLNSIKESESMGGGMLLLLSIKMVLMDEHKSIHIKATLLRRRRKNCRLIRLKRQAEEGYFKLSIRALAIQLRCMC